MSSPAAINASLLLWETLFGTDNVCCITAPPPPFYIFLQGLNGCLFILAAQQRPSQTAIVISPPLWQMHTKCGIGLRLSSAVDLCLFLKSVFKLCWRRGHTVIWRYSTCLHSEAFSFLTGQQIRGGGGGCRNLNYISRRETWQLPILQLSEWADFDFNNGCSEAVLVDVNWKQRKGAVPHSIMNQLIPLQMMDQVAMATDVLLRGVWRSGCFPEVDARRSEWFLQCEAGFGY